MSLELTLSLTIVSLFKSNLYPLPGPRRTVITSFESLRGGCEVAAHSPFFSESSIRSYSDQM